MEVLEEPLPAGVKERRHRFPSRPTPSGGRGGLTRAVIYEQSCTLYEAGVPN